MRSTIHRVGRLALVAATVCVGLGVLGGSAQADETCSDWADVTSYEGDGYTNFRHMVVIGQTQQCTDAAEEQHDYARAVLRHESADPLTEYPFGELRVLIRHKTDEHGGCWCEDVYHSGGMPEPGVGNTFVSPRVPVEYGGEYQASVQIDYAGAPTGYGQEGHQQWFYTPAQP
ncbi:MAG: hypothetical protein ACRDXB_10795 [Actinomycetes bacterium]